MSMLSRDGTIMVPVANPETVDRLIDTAIDVARGRSMRIVVVHVVEIPPQVPLSEGGNLLDANGEESRLLDDAVEHVADAGIEVESRIRYARDVATGIVGAVDVHDADALIVGWRGRPRRRDVVLGRFLDRVLGEAPCDVFVKRIRTPVRRIHSILVPVAGGPHAELAVEFAGTIATQRDARVRLLHVQDPGASDATREEAKALVQDCTALLDGMGVDVGSAFDRNEHVAGAITDETENHDLTVLGATEKPFLRRTLVGSVAEGVGRAAAGSVILARRVPK